MSCDMCEKTFSAESFDEWFGQMKTHYMSDDADVRRKLVPVARCDAV